MRLVAIFQFHYTVLPKAWHATSKVEKQRYADAWPFEQKKQYYPGNMPAEISCMVECIKLDKGLSGCRPVKQEGKSIMKEGTTNNLYRMHPVA
jgi:hypothetical protein